MAIQALFGAGNSTGFGTTGAGTANSAAFSKATLSNLAVGDLLVVGVAHQQSSTGTITPPSGFTRIGPALGSPSYTTSRLTGLYFYPITDSTALAALASTLTFTFSGTARVACVAFRVTGADLSAVEDVVASTYTGAVSSVNTLTVSGITTSDAATLELVLAYSQRSAGVAYAFPTAALDAFGAYSTTTAGSTIASSDIVVGTRVLSSAGATGNEVVTWGGNYTNSGGYIVSISQGLVVQNATVDLSSTSTLTAGGSVSSAGASVDLSSSSTLGAAAVGGKVGVVTLASASTLSATGSFDTSKVDAFIADQPFYVAHRGGSTDFVECTMEAYDQSIAYGAKAVEAPCWITTDGVWVVSHDQNTSRMFGTSHNINAVSWATISGLTTTVGGHPILRLDDLIAKWGGKVVMFLDNKVSASPTSWFAMMSSAGGPRWCVYKNIYNSSATLRNQAVDLGYRMWGYYYTADLANLAATHGPWDFLGFEYSGTQGNWDTILAVGKPVIAHVCLTSANVTSGLSKGAHGAMTGAIVGVIPAGQQGAVALTSSSTLGANAGAIVAGAVALSSSSVLSTAAVRNPVGSVTLTGSSTLGTTAVTQRLAAAALISTLTTIIGSSVTRESSSALIVTSFLVASAEVVTPSAGISFGIWNGASVEPLVLLGLWNETDYDEVTVL